MLEFNEPDIKGYIAQPSNTFTAFAYIIVAFAIFGLDKLVGGACLILALTTIFFHSKNTPLGQWLDISSIIILIIILIIKGFPFNHLNQPNFLIGVTLLILAWIFWIIDIKKLKIIPKNHILTGHGVWHILTAASIWFI